MRNRRALLFRWQLPVLFLGFPFSVYLAAAESESIREELDRAEAAHAEAVQVAHENILRSFEEELQSLAGDPDALRELEEGLNSFRQRGELPAAKSMEEPVESYLHALEAADRDLVRAYQKAVSLYTRNRELEKAETLDRESRLFFERRSEKRKHQRGELIVKILLRAKGSYQRKVEEAKRIVLEAVEGEIEKKVQAGDLDGIQEFRELKKTIQDSNVLPEKLAPALQASKSRFERVLEAANKDLNSQYNQVIRQALQGDHGELAKEVLLEKDSFATRHQLRLNPKIPRDAILFQGHGYLMIPKPASWMDAMKYCERRGGHLASINDPNENEFLRSKFPRDFMPEKERVIWIGLHDTGLPSGRKTNIWSWVSGEAIGYQNWASGQPSNHRPEFLGGQMENGEWHDFDRGRHKFPFVCEWINREKEFMEITLPAAGEPTTSSPR